MRPGLPRTAGPLPAPEDDRGPQEPREIPDHPHYRKVEWRKGYIKIEHKVGSLTECKWIREQALWYGASIDEVYYDADTRFVP